METASDLWRRKLAVVFKTTNIQGGHPHRFRHTFAVELLKNGVPMEEVSILDTNNAWFVPENVTHCVFAKPPRVRNVLHGVVRFEDAIRRVRIGAAQRK
jgi:hypothetical protein